MRTTATTGKNKVTKTAIKRTSSRNDEKKTETKTNQVEARKPSVPRATLKPRVPCDDQQRMIAEAAYFLAESRGFNPGHELEDWLTAENLVKNNFGSNYIK
jgi:hypothetical protein